MKIQEMRENVLAGRWTVSDTLSILDDLDRLQSLNRWIPVSERLPDVKGEYLCYLKPDIFTCFFGDSWSGTLAFRTVIAPTHWRPLPQPPEVTQ